MSAEYQSRTTFYLNNAVDLFKEALLQSSLRRCWAALTHTCRCLTNLDAVLENCPVAASHYAGLRSIPIKKIRGTEDKAQEFDADFKPLHECSRDRWVGIALQKLSGCSLPPVDLIQVGEVYFVRDGHHHISVSHALGQDYIEAEITILQLRQKLI